jgi:hypothetical protein
LLSSPETKSVIATQTRRTTMLNTFAKTFRRTKGRSDKSVDNAKTDPVRALSAEETKLVSGGLVAPGEPVRPYRPGTPGGGISAVI